MNNSHLLDGLNNILQYLNDSFNGYQLNLKDISDSRLKSILEKMCFKRKDMIEEIKSLIIKSGGTPKDQGTMMGKLHQWYQDIKNTVTEGDPLSISKQIRTGESILINAYKDVINEKLPKDIHNLLISQLSQIEDDLKEIEIESVD